MHNHFSRRKFLKTTALTGAALAIQPRVFGANALSLQPPAPGIQLWSVRTDLEKDPAGGVKALADMGYKKLEGFGLNSGKMFGMPVADFIKITKDNGLNMISSHCSFGLSDYDNTKNELTDGAKKAIDDGAKHGMQYIVNPYMGDKERGEIAAMVKVFQAAAAYCQKAGVRFAYHNHDFEFTKRGPDDRLLIEWLLQEIDPKQMDFEMDIYWVAFAKYNPLDWFRIYPGRWKLCHAKDMSGSEQRETIEVGDGTIDFNTIFKQRVQAGLQHYIIELEHYKTTPLQGAKRAREGFMKLQF